MLCIYGLYHDISDMYIICICIYIYIYCIYICVYGLCDQEVLPWHDFSTQTEAPRHLLRLQAVPSKRRGRGSQGDSSGFQNSGG